MEWLGGELGDTGPVDSLVFVGLVTVIVAAMRVPSAVRTMATFRALSRRDSGPIEGNLRAVVRAAAYVLFCGAFAAGARGAVGRRAPRASPASVGDRARSDPDRRGSLPVQRTRPDRGQTPHGLLLASWRSERTGGALLGRRSAAYDLGCCWTLMLVAFVAGAIGLLWMGTFSGLVEKVAGRSGWFTRGLAISPIVAGLVVAGTSVGVVRLG